MQDRTGAGLRVGAPAAANASASSARPARQRPPRRQSTLQRPARKALDASSCARLEELPNIGVSLAKDLRLIGIEDPRQLATADAMALYRALCARTGKRQDPCVLDTFMAIVDFMRGAPPAPWWQYTVKRKALYGQVGHVGLAP